ncbi:amidase [Xylaria palmicola]|nr:amidase [Xylaria palmicola]
MRRPISHIPHQVRRLSITSNVPFRLKINADRLNETLHHTCQWGAAHRYGEGPTQTGMARLSLSDDDARARRWFAEETQKLGCELKLDRMGNMFARRAGRLRSKAPMTGMGSHLDTQPRGGRYNGILGVVAAVEVLRTLHENGFETEYDVGAINWTNEEGARFPKSMVSSGVWAGMIPLEKAWGLADIFDPSVTMKSELERHGLVGDLACSSDPATGFALGAHFELHIEQGPTLEETGKRIGVGRDAHTGTTPLRSRRDPILAAAKMIASSNAIAKRLGALASTGVIQIPPSASTNTVASQAVFTLDIRHPRDEVVAAVQEECLVSFREIAREDGRGVDFTWTLDTDSPAAEFAEDCVRCVRDAADSVVGPENHVPIVSGAGHDSVHASAKCPSAMIFVPCKDGVSHHPEEFCKPEDCAIGTQTLLEAVLRYDQLRASKA